MSGYCNYIGNTMRFLLLTFTLIFSQVTFAIGPEDQGFVGQLSNKKIIGLSFVADPNIYGGETKELSRCYDEGVRVVCNAENNKLTITYLSSVGTKKQIQSARKLYKKLYPNQKIGEWNSEGVYNNNLFICKTGCSTSVPAFLILITHGD